MYLYRFDSLEKLRAQRQTDPVLRARRTFGNEPEFLHFQVVQEMQTIGEGEGVFRMSFWKTWEDLRANLWAHRAGSGIQRVRKDHEAFASFKRDHDEYLKAQAWFYWASMPLVSANDKWSPIGIPHIDIEILHPNGQWMSMDSIPALNYIAGEGWDTYTLSGSSDTPAPLWATVRTRASDPSGSAWVVLRQPSGPWGAWLGNPSRLNPLLLHLAEQGGFNPMEVRWIYAIEYPEEVRAAEIFPVFHRCREPGLQGYWNRWMGRIPQRQWEVFNNDKPDFLSDHAINTLYADLGLEEALRRGKRWNYENLVPSLEELQARRQEQGIAAL